MTDRERDPADSGHWPLGELIRRAMQGRSENSVAELSKSMGEDYRFARQTLRHYTFGIREDGSTLKVTANTVRRIAAVLEIDVREALRAAGLPDDEVERTPPRGKPGAPLDSVEVLAKKLAVLRYEDRAAFQQLLDSLVGRDAIPERSTITSTPGGRAWQGHRSAGGRGVDDVPAEESHGSQP